MGYADRYQLSLDLKTIISHEIKSGINPSDFYGASYPSCKLDYRFLINYALVTGSSGDYFNDKTYEPRINMVAPNDIRSSSQDDDSMLPINKGVCSMPRFNGTQSFVYLTSLERKVEVPKDFPWDLFSRMIKHVQSTESNDSLFSNYVYDLFFNYVEAVKKNIRTDCESILDPVNIPSEMPSDHLLADFLPIPPSDTEKRVPLIVYVYEKYKHNIAACILPGKVLGEESLSLILARISIIQAFILAGGISSGDKSRLILEENNLHISDDNEEFMCVMHNESRDGLSENPKHSSLFRKKHTQLPKEILHYLKKESSGSKV